MARLFNSPRNILVLGIVILCFQSAFAHTYLSSVYLNNQLLAEGDCVRPHPRYEFDYPIPLVTSQEMTCGWLPDAARAANRKCPIAAGSKIGIQWHHNSNSPSDDILEATHVGPINFYLAKSDTGAGDVWFKIYEDGFKDGKWAVDRMLANRGRVDVTIPSDIAPGNYLLRGEIFALHGAYVVNGIQPYVGCVELTISGSGTAKPAGVAFPGYYKNTDPGMIVSVYQPIVNYVIPGPPLYVSGSSTSGSSTSSPTSTPTATPSIAPTTRPTTSPTATPSAGNIQVGLNGNTNVWWVGVLVSGGAETTVKVELMDSGAVRSWTTLVDMSYSYVYSAAAHMQPPISLRLTSSTGKQVVLIDIFTSLSTNGQLIDSGKSYSSSESSTPAPQPTTIPTPTATPTVVPTTIPTTPPTKPTQTPTVPPTPKPTVPATQPPTTPPSSNGDNAKVTVFDSASQWWFALTVSGADVAKVELKDSASVTAYTTMNKNVWGSQEVYAFEAQSSALVTPILVQITSKSGKTEVALVTRIAANAVFEASS